MEYDNNIPLSSRIAALVHAHFDSLPTHYKPRTRNDGSSEWIPMSGFVLVQGRGTQSETLTCVAVATGAKCLSATQIPSCRGMVLHDSHAEVLALRALNYWLINECSSIIQLEQEGSHPQPDQNGGKKTFVRRRSTSTSHNNGPPFEIHPDIDIYMYSTCAPCGDASMELCMAEQEDSAPWTVPIAHRENKGQPVLLDGRAHFSILGVVRRKPSRADAEPTLSKSCSDKLALRQVTSILSYSASILVAPTRSAYITALVLPEEEISRVGCERAFGGGSTGRMRGLVNQTLVQNDAANNPVEYCFRPFEILPVSMEIVKARWPYGRYRSDTVNKAAKAGKTGNISAVWIASTSSLNPYQVRDASFTEHRPRISPQSTTILECIVNGVKQGSRPNSMTLRGASVLSRVKMWTLVHDLCALTSTQDACWQGILESRSYGSFKRRNNEDIDNGCSWLAARSLAVKRAKLVLTPWISNSGDEDWCKEDIIALSQENRKRKLT